MEEEQSVKPILASQHQARVSSSCVLALMS